MLGEGEEYIGQVNPRIVMVDRNQDVEEVVRNVRQDNLTGKNKSAHIVKNILAHNVLNVGIHRPNFVSPLSDYVLQVDPHRR